MKSIKQILMFQMMYTGITGSLLSLTVAEFLWIDRQRLAEKYLDNYNKITVTEIV
jgi:hypothetical protein